MTDQKLTLRVPPCLAWMVSDTADVEIDEDDEADYLLDAVEGLRVPGESRNASRQRRAHSGLHRTTKLCRCLRRLGCCQVQVQLHRDFAFTVHCLLPLCFRLPYVLNPL